MSVRVVPKEQVQKRDFSPYVSNGGTVIAVSGEDFCVIGGDTRMSFGYSIASRNVNKTTQLTDKCVIATAGMQAEAATLHRRLQAHLTIYKHEHKRDMATPAIAQLLSYMLYQKRFFPYYTFNVVGGVDKEGKGCVYGYDAVGSFQRLPYSCSGSGSALVTSILDNQVAFKTQPTNKRVLPLDETVAVVKDCFVACGERDIYTGDSVDIYVLTKGGIVHEVFPLKKD